MDMMLINYHYVNYNKFRMENNNQKHGELFNNEHKIAFLFIKYEYKEKLNCQSQQ